MSNIHNDRSNHSNRCPPASKTYVFKRYGIDDGSALIRAVHVRLRRNGFDGFEPTASFATSLETAFAGAFATKATLPLVPGALTSAIEDAVAQTMMDMADTAPRSQYPDLRTIVLPYFYARVVDKFRVAVELGIDHHTGVRLVLKGR